jgi:2-dehydro-3-deoxy-D-arabinonate dehydratase
VLLTRYRDTDGSVRTGLRRADTITPLQAESVAELLRGDTTAFADAMGAVAGPDVATGSVTLLPPVDGRMEVWASGVTYRRSREARVEESQVASVYDLVYDAERPELFFKAPAWRVVTDGEPIGIREDSQVDVPEAELALVLNSRGETVGYTVCNDMSSRNIEGENPLYLPQAKVYAGSCAIGSGIRLAADVPDPYNLDVEARIEREGSVVWSASTSTAQLHRRLDELAAALFRGLDFPDGAVLSTGTGVVPDLDVTTREGDVVTITIEGVGILTNRVVSGVRPFEALSDLRRHRSWT